MARCRAAGNGRILVAWTMTSSDIPSIRFSVLDSSYKPIAGPAQAGPVAATDGVPTFGYWTRDRAILTWMDWNSFTVLCSGGRRRLRPDRPMIFRSSQATSLPSRPV